MTPSYLSHFGLSLAPFSKEIADADLWLPSSKSALVEELCEALRQRQSVVLTGEPGVGKTCVLRALRHRLPHGGFRLTYCHNATLGRRDFYRQLCLALGLKPSATAAAVFYAVATHVEQLGQERTHPVFLLDESHLLHQDVLDHLHILLNYQWDSLTPLCPEDTAEYLRVRLAQAGCERELFASDAVAMLHEAASGALRDMDRLATAALREAARKKKKLVERDTLARVLDSGSHED